MKKLTPCLLAIVMLCYSEFIFSASTLTMMQEPHWTGYYLGGNAGYWGSQNNHVSNTGSPSFINQAYVPGASNVANALAKMANNSASLNAYGFTFGGQAGYNFQFTNAFLLGFNIDFDGITNSNNDVTLHKNIALVDYDENYLGSLTVKQKINYLGTVRARLGFLYNPTFLIYATGGFAYSNVTLDTAWTAQESLGSTVFPGITTQNNSSNTLTGWAAGAGIEWLFQPNWSAMLEYTYYSLNDFNVPATLTQINSSLSPPVRWASAATNTALSLSLWNISVGLNYHFL